MAEIKTFKIIGEINKPNYNMKFVKDIRAIKADDAVDKIYADFGGQYKVKRYHIKIQKIEETSLQKK